MEYRDRQAFLEAAEGWKVWVVVRRSNPESEPYIGKPGYVPKTNECKAKTADFAVDKFGKRIRTAGLVVNPWIHPEAFAGNRLVSARREWDGFAARWLSPSRKYTVDEDRSHEHHGCAMLQGKYLYSDYDLFDIIDAVDPLVRKQIRGRFNTQVNYHSTHFKAVMQFVNSRIRRDGKPVWMIQHGEGTYVMKGRLDGGGAEVFGPCGKSLAVNCHFDFDQWFKREFGYSYPPCVPGDNC